MMADGASHEVTCDCTNFANSGLGVGRPRSSSFDDEKIDVDHFSDDFVKAQEEMWSRLTTSASNNDCGVDTPAGRHRKGPPQYHKNLKQAPSACSENNKNDEDFSNLLEDQSMIEEQRRILLKIQQEQQQQQLAASSPRTRSRKEDWPAFKSFPSYATTRTSSSSATVASSDSTTTHGGVSARSTNTATSSKPKEQVVRQQRGGAAAAAGHDEPKRNPVCHQNDQILRMGDHNLRVKGTKHAYNSISNGEATIVQCSSCQAILQVGVTAKLLYCVHCQQVTPIEEARNVSAGRIGATDVRIAKTLQMQEVGVASARKLRESGGGSAAVLVGADGNSSRFSVIPRSRRPMY